MSEFQKPHGQFFSSVDDDRRKIVKQLIAASAFAVPLTLAAALDGSPIREARAQDSSTVSSAGAPISSAGAKNIPEPSTLALLGGGVAMMAYMRKRGLKARGK